MSGVKESRAGTGSKMMWLGNGDPRVGPSNLESEGKPESITR